MCTSAESIKTPIVSLLAASLLCSFILFWIFPPDPNAPFKNSLCQYYELFPNWDDLPRPVHRGVLSLKPLLMLSLKLSVEASRRLLKWNASGLR